MHEINQSVTEADRSTRAKAALAAATLATAATMVMAGWSGAAAAEQHEPYMPVVAASELMGLDVETSDGQEAGEIEYILISGASGIARYVLLTLEDDMEIGYDELVALPFTALDVASADGDDVTVDVSMAKLKGAMRLKEDRIAEFIRPISISQVYEYYGSPKADRIQSSSRNGTTERKDRSADEQPSSRERSAKYAREKPRGAGGMEGREEGEPHVVVGRSHVSTLLPGMTETRELLGADVQIRGDDDFGEIDEIVLAAKTGMVAYVLISDGGFLGIGDEWYALPLQSLSWNSEAEVYVTKVPLKNDGAARRFTRDEDDLPRRIRRTELQRFYEAFGIKGNLLAAR